MGGELIFLLWVAGGIATYLLVIRLWWKDVWNGENDYSFPKYFSEDSPRVVGAVVSSFFGLLAGLLWPLAVAGYLLFVIATKGLKKEEKK